MSGLSVSNRWAAHPCGSAVCKALIPAEKPRKGRPKRYCDRTCEQAQYKLRMRSGLGMTGQRGKDLGIDPRFWTGNGVVVVAGLSLDQRDALAKFCADLTGAAVERPAGKHSSAAQVAP